ncbi:HisA/HisF-related TIM barrel protein [Hypericibacter sp.]|uniref:HisA/HisF-related TIM barrel protein n=1 Tax=Hypericibacter sp. TaxID=2705401 RepID=UPI003D6D3C83
MDFIFMLTRDDQTIEDCVELYDTIRALPLRHVGFKDVGVPVDVLRKLHGKLKADGRVTYMEVVSTSEESCLRSAQIGLDLGVDCLLGGTQVDLILPLLKGSRTGYYPFPGIPVGHPTKLGGSPQRIASDTRSALTKGCAGVDLLAYRATEADPLDLIRAARSVTDKPVIVAGSINSPKRIRDIAAAGASLFTIGTAALDGSFYPRNGLLTNQLKHILEACAATA